MGADAGPLWSQLSQRKTWEEPCLQRYNPICHRGQSSQPYHPAGEGLCALTCKTEEGNGVRDGLSHPLASLGWRGVRKVRLLPSSGSRVQHYPWLCCVTAQKLQQALRWAKGSRWGTDCTGKEAVELALMFTLADFVCWFVSLLCCGSHPNHASNDITAQCILWDDSLAWKLLNSCYSSPATQLWHWLSHSFPEGT